MLLRQRRRLQHVGLRLPVQAEGLLDPGELFQRLCVLAEGADLFCQVRPVPRQLQRLLEPPLSRRERGQVAERVLLPLRLAALFTDIEFFQKEGLRPVVLPPPLGQRRQIPERIGQGIGSAQPAALLLLDSKFPLRLREPPLRHVHDAERAAGIEDAGNVPAVPADVLLFLKQVLRPVQIFERKSNVAQISERDLLGVPLIERDSQIQDLPEGLPRGFNPWSGD